MKIGTFTLGGGYAMIPLIEEEIVQKNKWIEQEEFIDIIAISQTIPGAMAINTSTYIGYRLFGFKGAILGCVGTILPSIVMMISIAVYFIKFQKIEIVKTVFKGIRPAVVALICSAVLRLAKTLPRKFLHLSWMALTVICITFFKVHPIWIIIISGAMGFYLKEYI